MGPTGVREAPDNLLRIVDAVRTCLKRLRRVDCIKASIVVQETVCRLFRFAKNRPKEANDVTRAINTKGKCVVRTRDIDNSEIPASLEETILHIVVPNYLGGVVDRSRRCAVGYARNINCRKAPANPQEAMLLACSNQI